MNRIITFILLCTINVGICAETNLKPLYEIGAGAVYSKYPYYPGSANQQTIFLPFPAFVFRGDVLRADQEEGIRGIFFESDLMELNLSFDGTLPSDGEDNQVREGMPKLDTLLEFGPKLIVHLFKSEDSKFKMDLHLPVRFAISSNLKRLDENGVAFNPFLSFSLEGLFGKDSMIYLTYGQKYASRKLHGYYYDVAKVYEMSSRPHYHSHSGLFETSLSAGAFYPIVDSFLIYGGYIRGFYGSAKNYDSPLLVKKETNGWAIGFVWYFYKTDILVPGGVQ